ncbi:MMPL family transporter [Streptomyces smyrnaeus]|uniref:MMPL family transporter n=1 Tax=Streptomyces TaxID=1883 RepID=UPI000C1913E0|nr:MULTISPECIES: MMPL family transporter [unclassified Streptomyces]MBQ0865306.1 MMPL family transporter [Streptomyces sp. RK75]MBQ1121822.1 MMPL family transporter [Streptomyces sp. B15]
MTALARWCLRRRLIVLLLWLAALGGAVTASSLIGSSYSDDYGAQGTESGQAAQRLESAFPDRAGGSDTIVWHTDGTTVRAAAVQERMAETLREVEQLPGVASVQSPYSPQGGGQISEDEHTAYADLTFDKPTDELGKEKVQRVVATIQDASDADIGLQAEAGGSGVAAAEAPKAHLAEAIGLAAAAIVLFLAFGSLAATALPLITAVVAVGTAAAGIGLLSQVMTVAEFAPMLGMLIGLGVGIDYALFIVTRHRRGLRAGLPVVEAARRAVTVSGRAVVFAGATVCIALLGMFILRLDFLNGVAIAACLTVLLSVAASITLLPALLGFIGMRALSRRERRQLTEHGPRPDRPTGFAMRWSAFVERHPRLLGAVAAVLMAVLALPALGLHLGTSDQGNDPAASTTRQAYDMLADGFGPGTNGPLTLVGELDGAGDKLAFDHLRGEIRDTPGVAQVSGPEFNGSGDTGVITVVPDSSPQSRSTSDLVDRLRSDVLPQAEEGSTMEVLVGGTTAGHDDFADIIVGKLPLFAGVVIGLGCLLLLLAFRSIGIPVKAAVMNIAAVAAAFGVVVAVFQWGWGSELLGLGSAGPIEPFLPVIMISVLFGLSMDYQVFLVSRMYEEWRLTGDNRRAVRVGLSETSRVINSAAVIMISVFGGFVLSGDRLIAMFGIALAAAVALDAFVLRTLLVPALMHMLGGANWWLPQWLDRRLPRLSIEPDTSGHEDGDAEAPVSVDVPLVGQRTGSLIGLSETAPTVAAHGYRKHEDHADHD